MCGVIPCACVKGVASNTANKAITSVVTIELVRTGTTEHSVITFAAVDDVIATI
jgi:hypothetical protein